MPLGAFEREVLRLLAANRNPDSFVGGATVLHQQPDSPRTSLDIDVFHDTPAALHEAAERDIFTLRDAGFLVEPGVLQPSFWRARVSKGAQVSKLEWVHDSAFRFYPVEPDAELGWRLNFWDAATNKVLAFAGRDKLRDCLDVIFLHERHLHLGALVWAAAAKDPGLTPELLLDSARRFTRFPAQAADWEALRLPAPADLTVMKKNFLEMTWAAEELVQKLPPAEMGCLYLDPSGKPVCPNPASPDFAKLTRHYGCLKGAWPRIVED